MFDTIRQHWKARNKKTGEIYEMETDAAISATNNTQGRRLVIYKKDKQVYVRDYNEFYEKFELVE